MCGYLLRREVMEITLSTADLNRALSVTQNIVAKKTTMPILVNVLLSAENDELTISATDLEIAAVVSTPAKVKSKGRVTLNGKIISEIVRELPHGEVTLKRTEGERVEIISKGSKLRMVGVSAEEYPSLPGVLFTPRSTIEAPLLLEMINKTIYAVSNDETRFNLNGVCLEIIEEGTGNKTVRSLRMVATDGHRLALVTRPAGNINFEGRVIVPKKGLAEIRKVLSPEAGTQVGFDIQDGFLIIESGDTRIAMRLVDGEFPNYGEVIPTARGVVASVTCQDLSQALRRTSLMVSDRSKCVRMDFREGELRITGASPELGDATEELAANYKDKPLSIGFNALYMLDVASSLGEAQRLNIELSGELGAGRFYAEGDESYFSIIMPMRLDG